jgi:hypothetical protein
VALPSLVPLNAQLVARSGLVESPPGCATWRTPLGFRLAAAFQLSAAGAGTLAGGVGVRP